MQVVTFKEYRELEEAGFCKEDLQEAGVFAAIPYILIAVRAGRALRNANKGLKLMDKTAATKMADDFMGPPKPVRFGDIDFVGPPGPNTLVRPSRFRNFAKQINMDPDLLANLLGGAIGLLVLILAFTMRRHIASVAKYILKMLKDIYGTCKVKFKKALDTREEQRLEKALIKQVA